VSRRDVVLVVDDDNDARELMALIVRAQRLEAREARNCCEAIEYANHSRDRLALVLLDYFMPGMPPRDCCENLRALVQRVVPVVPIVLVTAAVDVSARAAELGLRHYLAKPFDLSDLERVLALAVTGQGAAHRPPAP
jgi:CheY-like chemotaxis protein